ILKPHAKKFCGLHIKIEKNIPMGAGLGGGSSNAATTLIVLNQLWECGLEQEQLADYGVKLGADVPIFIYGKNAWAEGIGEHLSFIDLDQKQFIILKPDCFISTQLLFSQKTLTRDSKTTKFCAYQLEPSNFGNNFEPLARQLYPEVEEAMQYLDQFGQAKLTGTGACVFIEVTNEMNIDEILKHSPCKSYLVNSLKESPLNHFKVTR
ncbi:4-(cytidine 5'-diphospho)-2-C-methyl-D-erythritol kinase, partial [Acinetobacter baumannii 573719]